MADDFDDAERKGKAFTDQYESIRSLKPREVKALVSALCGSDGDKDDFESISRDVAGRVRDEVRQYIETLMKLRDDAKSALDKAARDDASKRSKARSRNTRRASTNSGPG
jgi:hypothetical protein